MFVRCESISSVKSLKRACNESSSSVASSTGFVIAWARVQWLKVLNLEGCPTVDELYLEDWVMAQNDCNLGLIAELPSYNTCTAEYRVHAR